VSGLRARFTGEQGGFSLDVAFEAPAGGVTALFGPSGAGKTSVLRAVAGLERFSGECRLDGLVWQDETHFVPPHERAIGYVFQEAGLFPHLTVRANLAFGLKRAGAASVITFDDAVDLLGVAAFLDRDPATLSGGERQRVALGLALLSQPKLLLLDEPMSALDTAAKQEIFPYFEALRRSVALPILLVTHDIGEVERLADQVVLLKAGAVAGSGPLNEVLLGEAAIRGAREAAAVLSGRIAGYAADDGLSEIAVGAVRFLVAGRAGETGAAVRVRVAARDVSLAVERPSATTILNVLPATIAAIEEVGDAEAIVTLRLGDDTMLARITRRSVRQLGLKVGQAVFAQVKGVSVLAGAG